MSPTRQQLRTADRLKKKEKNSSEQIKARAKHRAEWNERRDNRLIMQRTPWRKFLSFLSTLLRTLGWQYYSWKKLANPERSTDKKDELAR